VAPVYQIERLITPQMPPDKRDYDLNSQIAIKTWAKRATDATNSLALVVNVVGFRQSPYKIAVVRNQFIPASSGTGADTVLVLPKATGSTNVVEVQKADSNAHNIVVNPTGLDKIGTANSPDTISTQGAHVRYLDYVAGTWAKLG
jgi:hypothetical protein